jgi:hypothetical protein
MNLFLVVALALSTAPAEPRPCELNSPVVVAQSGDYGPGGTGPSFRFALQPHGDIQLRSQRWRVPDGRYSGRLVGDDWSRLTCLLADIENILPKESQVVICPHAPDFGVTAGAPPRTLSICVEKLKGSSLEELYRFVFEAVCHAQWESFTPAAPDKVSWLFVSPSPALCESPQK